jgi:hypothetical protein
MLLLVTSDGQVVGDLDFGDEIQHMAAGRQTGFLIEAITTA